MVERIVQHPMMRALRVDKITLAALAATLRLYRDPDACRQSVPLLSMLSTPLENLKNRAERLAPQMAVAGAVASAEAIECEACLGGGSAPAQRVASFGIAITPKGMSTVQMIKALRSGAPSVFARIQNDRLILDLRTVVPAEDMALVQAVERLTQPAEAAQG